MLFRLSFHQLLFTKEVFCKKALTYGSSDVLQIIRIAITSENRLDELLNKIQTIEQNKVIVLQKRKHRYIFDNAF